MNDSVTSTDAAQGEYLLRGGHPADPGLQQWYLFDGQPTDGRCLGAFGVDLNRPQLAQRDARHELRRHAIRVLAWEQIGTRLYRAVPGPARGGWQVVAYQGRDGTTWRRTGRGWCRSGELRPRYTSETALETAEGPLAALDVDNLDAAVEELRMFATRTVYYHGQAECHERECDGYDRDGNVIDPGPGKPLPDRHVCAHVREQIANAVDAVTLDRVRLAMDSLRAEATVTADQVDRYTMSELTELGGVGRALVAIQDAMQDDA